MTNTSEFAVDPVQRFGLFLPGTIDVGQPGCFKLFTNMSCWCRAKTEWSHLFPPCLIGLASMGAAGMRFKQFTNTSGRPGGGVDARGVQAWGVGVASSISRKAFETPNNASSLKQSQTCLRSDVFETPNVYTHRRSPFVVA